MPQSSQYTTIVIHGREKFRDRQGEWHFGDQCAAREKFAEDFSPVEMGQLATSYAARMRDQHETVAEDLAAEPTWEWPAIDAKVQQVLDRSFAADRYASLPESEVAIWAMAEVLVAIWAMAEVQHRTRNEEYEIGLVDNT